MSNLRLLVLSNVHLARGLKCFSSALKVLEWKGYPLTFLPLDDVGPDELVDLKLHHSKIKQCWNRTQFLGQIKFVDLSQSKDLIKTPDFTGMPNLERLVLEGCISITEIHPSIAQHKRLVVLNLKDCKNLKTLPRKLEMNSLEIFVLSGCSKIGKLSEFGEDMIKLSVLDLEGTSISKLPDTLNCLIDLAVLNLRNCRNIGCLPSNIWNFKSLRSFNISGCSKFSSIPENLNDNETLEELNVSGTAIREVPSSIVHLKNLKRLYCIGCQGSTISWTLPLPFGINIKFGNDPEVSPGLSLPPSISHLASLQILNLSYCSLSPSMIPNDLGASMPSLKDLNLRGNSFGNVAAGSSLLPFSSLTSLNILNLSDCFLRDGSIPDDLSNLSSLQQLNFMGNYFTNLPSKCLANLPGLELLWINSCPNLQSLPELPPNLERLDASDSVSLEESLSDPQHLWSLFASLDLQRSDEEGHVVLQIPGSEVPSWFENRSFCIDEEMRNLCGYDSAVSIVASIPDCWRSSEWSGIAMCVVVEGQVWEDLWERVIFWSSKCLDEDEWPKRIYGYDVQGSVDRPQLFIRFLPFTHDNCWQYVHGEKKQLQFLLATKTRPRKGAHHSDQGPTRKLEITKCGWRALCKEDVQEYWRISASREE
ncbi:hypothetical protein Fmac_016874 [Flemingia macrophylla]|uniref:Uncharacterized protein n=1 Tax=Flemingia macrophylla TaxID=520843 RepID=A0ABD1MIP9_9FABA